MANNGIKILIWGCQNISQVRSFLKNLIWDCQNILHVRGFHESFKFTLHFIKFQKKLYMAPPLWVVLKVPFENIRNPSYPNINDTTQK